MIRLLVVDDSALMRRVLGEVFAREPDFELAFARDGLEALARLTDFQPDVVTLDINMPQMDGLDCLDRIMLARPTPVVMLSSLTRAGAETTLAALQLGAVDFIAKPAGTISLAMDELAPLVVEKVRGAAGARLRAAIRLSERVRLRSQSRGPIPGAGLANNSAAKPIRAQRPAMPAAAAVPERGAALQDTSADMSPGPADGILLVGCSTGGPPALDALLAPLPADFPWPVVVAQHMPAGFTGALARRLDRLCAVEVSEVVRPEPLLPGHVYIGRGDADVVVAMRPSGLVVMAAPSLPAHRWHPSVDRLVASALQHIAANRLIGVLMTGMGYDGAAEMTRLHAQGGRTIAEAEETAVVWGMPGELVKAGGAQLVVPLGAIAAQLLSWAAGAVIP